MNHFVVNQRKLFYRDEGLGRAVLLLHGAVADETEWDPQIPALVEAGYRAVYPLRAGCGDSDPYPEGTSLAREAADMIALLDHLELEAAVLVGHSQGAFVARQIYLAAPRRVAAIVSVDGFAFGKLNCKTLGAPAADEQTRELHKQNAAALEQLGRPWDFPSPFNVERLRSHLRDKRESPDRWRRRVSVDDPADMDPPPGPFCRVPLLVFVTTRGHFGADDPRVDDLRSRIPAKDPRIVAVVHSGHWIHHEQADRFNRELIGFLDRLP